MVEFLLKLVRDVDANEVKVLRQDLLVNADCLATSETHLVIIHLQYLLLIRRLGLDFAMVKRRFGLLSPGFNFLACAVIFPLGLLQFAVRSIAFLFQLGMVLGMAFANLLELRSGMFQRFRHMSDQFRRKLVSLGRVGFDGVQLGCPSRQGSAFQGARGQAGSIANTQRADLLGFAVVIFIAQGRQFRGIFLLDGAPLAIKL